MCLIIAAYPHRELPVATFHAAINSAISKNPDGIGLAYPDNGKVVIQKTTGSYDPVIKQALDLYKTNLPFFVHLRFTTVGHNTKANTHPFKIAGHLAMAHNRTLDIEPPHLHWSDSRTVAELLKTLVAGDASFFDSPLFWSFMEHQAGADNRFAFLDAQREDLVIVNDHLGVEVDGLWFSNLYAWKPATVGLSRWPEWETKMPNDRACDDWDRFDLGVDVEEDLNDLPLVWGSDRLDRRQLEPAF